GGALGVCAGMHFFTPESSLAFLVGGIVPALSALLLWRWLPAQGVVAQGDHGALRLDFGRNLLSFGTAWSQGFLEGGLLAFLALYLLSLVLPQDTTGGLLGVSMAGVILFQVPVAWLADRLGRTVVLVGCYCVVIAGLVLLPLCGPTWWLAVGLFAFGASS